MPVREAFAPAVRRPALDLRAAAFDRLGACAAVLDSKGVTVDTNRAWRLLGHVNGGTPDSTGIGVNCLTGLPNRRAAGRYLEEGLELARATDTTMWVKFIDIDGFESVNDGRSQR